jgi:hypothetical protein
MPTKAGKSVRDVMVLVPAAHPLPHLATAKEDASKSVIHRWKMRVITEDLLSISPSRPLGPQL